MDEAAVISALTLSPRERAFLDSIGEGLRAEGWASFVTVQREFASWSYTAADLARRPSDMDLEFANDLASRDVIQMAIDGASASLRYRLEDLVAPIDREFRSVTVEDSDRLLGRGVRIREGAGWWWQRIPANRAQGW
jgi:hypothetical protein